MAKLSPSILSADFMNLEKQITLLEKLNVPYLHLDVMDGVFVPNISFGIPVIDSIRKATNIILDTHLMIVEPERYIDDFINAGCDIINFHFEATKNHTEIIKKVKNAGKKVGMTIKPDTPAKSLIPYLSELDLVLVMTVEPGFGGQSFIKSCADKIKFLRNYIDENNLKCEIEVDGGVKFNIAEELLNIGADVFVVGSEIFASENKEEVVSKYMNLFNKRHLCEE